jgi:hypothetical protein
MDKSKGSTDAKEDHKDKESGTNSTRRATGQPGRWQASKYQRVRLDYKIKSEQNLAEINEELKVSREREEIK